MTQVGEQVRDSIYDFVRSDALREFGAFVTELGGDPYWELRNASIDVDLLESHNGIFSYRSLATLLQNCAANLNCRSFGMSLAARQVGKAIRGPLEIAMGNCTSLERALVYCREYLQSYSPAVELEIGPARKNGTRYIRLGNVITSLSRPEQSVEHVIALLCEAIGRLSSGEIQPSEVWLAHAPISEPFVYRELLGTRTLFDKPFTGVFIRNEDFLKPILARDPKLYRAATSYIEAQSPAADSSLGAMVKAAIVRLLAKGCCTGSTVAEMLDLHPRTLQRRLSEEGMRFSELRDEARRELALRYLADACVTLEQIARLLGYSDVAVLVRSSHRWFAAPPREVRRNLMRIQSGDSQATGRPGIAH